MTLKRRLEQLEQQSESETACMVVIGEPTPEQQSAINKGRVRLVVRIPDNGRERDGRNRQNAN